jgi:hypothetical protein
MNGDEMDVLYEIRVPRTSPAAVFMSWFVSHFSVNASSVLSNRPLVSELGSAKGTLSPTPPVKTQSDLTKSLAFVSSIVTSICARKVKSSLYCHSQEPSPASGNVELARWSRI